MGENHPGQTRLETAETKADRIVAEELSPLQWTQSELAALVESHSAKLVLAARSRQETTRSVQRDCRTPVSRQTQCCKDEPP